MKKLLLILTLFLSSTFYAHAQSYITEEGKAVFYSKVPLHNFSGTSNNLTGRIDLNDKSVDFYIDLETLDTGNGKRDRDMKKTLKTDKYPYGEFLGTLVSDFDANSDAEQAVKVKGTFKIHGHEQEIEVEGTLQKTAEGLVVKASWILNLDDYEIKPPKILFVKVDEKQEIEIEAVLKPE